MAQAEERLMEWLRDAHAMEQQAIKMLSAQAQRIQNYPELSARISSHLDETKRQAERLNACIERRGSSTSILKDTAGKMVAFGQGLSGVFAGDEVVKGSIFSKAFEDFEIASYKVLIAAADMVGDAETRRVCEENLREEEAMASWLDQHLEPLTRQYLTRTEAESDAAKR